MDSGLSGIPLGYSAQDFVTAKITGNGKYKVHDKHNLNMKINNLKSSAMGNWQQTEFKLISKTRFKVDQNSLAYHRETIEGRAEANYWRWII